MRTIQGEMKVRIEEAKEKYRKKLEWKLQENNLREVWSGKKIDWLQDEQQQRN